MAAVNCEAFHQFAFAEHNVDDPSNDFAQSRAATEIGRVYDAPR
jgi:hypothetical protein